MILLSGVVLLGVLSARDRHPPALTVGLHRCLGLGMAVFVAMHVVTCVVDSYVPLGWMSAVVPFTAEYHRQWVGVGTLALDVFVAVVVTSALRLRLSDVLWRSVHWLSYLLGAAAVVHGVAMADSDPPALLAITVACGGVMVVAGCWGMLRRSPDRSRRRRLPVRGWT